MPELSRNEKTQRVQVLKQSILSNPNMMASIAATLPRGSISPERIANLGIAAYSRTPKLAECDTVSVIGSLLQCATLGLEPNTPLGHCWILPYFNGKARRMEAQLIVGYQGMIDLARRSERLASLRAHVVRKSDDFDYQLGLNLTLTHKPKSSVEPIKAVYAVAKLKEAGADPLIEVMTIEELEAHRDRFAPKNKAGEVVGPWKSDFEAMCLKTVVRRLWKWLPKSTEAAQAMALDEASDRKESQASRWDDSVRTALEHSVGQAEVARITSGDVLDYDVDTGEVSDAEPKPVKQAARPQLEPQPEPSTASHKSKARQAVERAVMQAGGDVAQAAGLQGVAREIYDLANAGQLQDAIALYENDKTMLSPVQQTEIAGFLHEVAEKAASK